MPLTTKQQALDIANEVYGSTDAHFMNGTKDTQIGFTDGGGYAQTINAVQVINANKENIA